MCVCLASAGHHPAPDFSLDLASPPDLGCEIRRRFFEPLRIVTNALQLVLDMIKGEASKIFIKVISHSLAVCLTSASPPHRHQGSSLLIRNTDPTQRRGPKDKTRFWTDNQPDPVVDGSGRRHVWLMDERGGYIFGHLLSLSARCGGSGNRMSACYNGQKAGQVFTDDTPATIPFISHPNLPPPSPSPVLLQRLLGPAGGGRIEDGRG